jgi:hypothetical protein
MESTDVLHGVLETPRIPSTPNTKIKESCQKILRDSSTRRFKLTGHMEPFVQIKQTRETDKENCYVPKNSIEPSTLVCG